MDNTLAGFDERLSESNWSASAGYPGGVLQQWTAPYNATVANGGAATAAASNNNNNNNSASSLVSSTPPGVGVATASQPSRVVVIHRDERGFGFVVAGDNPVFVQTVREGGAAERAGIVKDDIIIKVNGSWVTQSNHAEVVDLIRAGGSCVALTVVSPVFGTGFAGNGVPVTVPQVCSNFSSTGMPSSPSSSGFGSPNLTPPPPPPPVGMTPTRGLHHQPSIHRSVGITSPQPVGHEQQRVVELERLNTFKLMLEKEQQFVETKRSELTRSYNPPGAVELANAEKRVRELQQKYNQMAHRLGLSASESQPQLSTIQTRSPPANRPQSTYFTGGGSGGGGRISGRVRPGAAEGGGWDNLGCDVPPPLPARNRSLVAQVSAPLLMASTMTMATPLNPPPSELATSPPPPPLPPRNPSSASSSSTSSSSSSSASSNSTYPSMPDVVPSGSGPGNGASGADVHHYQRTAGQHQRDSPTNQPTCSSGSKRPNTSPLPSHHRTKSSPFPFAVQPVTATTPDTRRFSSSDSISELDATAKRTSNNKDTDSPTHGTPPGTPPPPYRRPVSPLTEDANGAENSAVAASGPAPAPAVVLAYSPIFTTATNQQAPSPGVLYTGQETQLPIMPMEDDDFSDHESGLTDVHNMFKTLATLWQHNAHLAVFINYVISNCDPASLLFHMITDLYKEGTAKDMKKWAYEIHSTYLVPNAPLKVTNVDEHVLHEIDDALQVDIDKEEILRKVFWKARAKAKEEIKRQLAEFRSKRTVGLANIFGPPDATLEETLNDKNKELKIVEGILVPKLESFSDDLENSSDRNLAVSASLATILQKHFNVKSPAGISLIERYPTFVSKEKSIKPKFLSKNKKQLTAKGHHFVAHQYFSVTQCNHCGNVLWGISPQGYLCTNCEMNIHKGCVRIIEESCIGAIHRKERGNDRISKIVDRFRPEREIKRKLTPQDKMRRPDDKDSMDTSMTGSLDDATGDKQTGPGSGSNGRSFTDGSRDRRSGTGSGSDSFGESDRRPGYTPPNEEELDSSLSAASKKKVSRSESLRERAQRKHREKRKHSDPNLPPSHSSDMDREDRSLSYNNSGSSSNSSLSTSLESPSPSDIVSNSRVSGSALSDGSSGVSAALSGTSITSLGGSGAGAERGGAGSHVQAPWDSDIEADPDPPDWTRNLDPDAVEKMPAKEKQRQEVINELFHTERSHVRNLKVLERVFYRPLLENGFSDLVNLLFPNLPEMLEIHGRFNAMMKARKRDQPAVEAVGDILLAMFDGPSGESFQQAAATFCKYQSVALENLRDRRKKESKLQAFLAEAEGNPVCRRLQLKDIIPTAMQRLTKYPLLLESLAKYTQPRSDEITAVRKSLERARDILNKVNQAVKEADNYNRLVDIQRRLDKSAFDKTDHPIANELKNFELTKHRLIYEGALTWRTKGQKNVDLHVVLLEEYILLLQKQDDKYVLKFHSINFLNSKEESKFTHSPIIKIATVLVRPVATDKLALFLVNTSPTGAQIYDLVAVSIAERKAWFRHITDATEAYKAREGRNRRPDGSPAPPLSGPSLSSSSSSAQLAPTAENPEKSASKEDEATDDNVSGDSGVSLTPSSGENPSPAETTSSAGAASSAGEPQPAPHHPATSSDGAQSEVIKKAGDGTGTPTSGSTSPAAGSAAASPAPQRRLQRVEILKIAEGTPLIDPAEVVVSQGAVLTAEPVLTPLEKLRRKDQVIRTALADKQRLVADILHVPHSDLEVAASSVAAAAPVVDGEGEKEARLLVMSAMTQASHLAIVLNETLRLTEEEAIAAVSDPSALSSGGSVGSASAGASSTASPRTSRRACRMPGAPTTKLLPISEALNRDLTQLLDIVSSRDEERENLRRELQKARDQLAELLVLQATAPASTSSRPASHVSLSDCDTSTVAEPTEESPIEASNNLTLDSELEVNEATNELLVPAESSSTAHEETNVVPDVIELVTEECSSEVDLPHNEQVASPAATEEEHATVSQEEKSDLAVDISESSEA